MPKEEVNAKKTTMKKSDALELASAASHIHAAKGKKVVHINVRKDQPDDDALAAVLLGPTGNLRAPSLRVGKKLIVGFNQEMYEALLGG